MSAYEDISSAIVQTWQAGGLSYPTAYEAVDFTPPAGPWCRVRVAPVSVTVAALGDAAPLEHVVLA